MRILLVSHGYPPFGVAGVERVASQTAELLIQRGHEVTVLTRRPSDAPPTLSLEHSLRNGVPVVSVAGGGATPSVYPDHMTSLETIFERTIAETTPDVVLISHLLHHSPGYVDIAHRWGIPVVMELHDFFVICPRAHLLRTSGEICEGPEGGAACAKHCFGNVPNALPRLSLRSHAFRLALERADSVLCPSRFVASSLAQYRGEHKSVEILENGVAELPTKTRLNENPKPLHVAGIGVTVEHKGFHVVIEAFKRAALPEASFTIFGLRIPPLDLDLHKKGNSVPGLTTRLFGRFEPVQLPMLLSDVDVVVVPSLVAETFSIVTREAFASGIPVLASAIGALPDAIAEGKNGFLFPPGDATSLALMLRRLHDEPETLSRLRNGAASTEVLTVEERTSRLEAILLDRIEQGVAPGPVDPSIPLFRDVLGSAGTGEHRSEIGPNAT